MTRVGAQRQGKKKKRNTRLQHNMILVACTLAMSDHFNCRTHLNNPCILFKAAPPWVHFGTSNGHL
jgi:hypothetical protein